MVGEIPAVLGSDEMSGSQRLKSGLPPSPAFRLVQNRDAMCCTDARIGLSEKKAIACRGAARQCGPRPTNNPSYSTYADPVQATGIVIAAIVLNRMLDLGRSQSVCVT
ncbi:MAG: hypothetical protein P4L10_00205 [Acidobacteriaceae bacterium]|nr:hypothetical protein [Acidobacteriaceae bacterium]